MVFTDGDIAGKALKCHMVILLETRLSPYGGKAVLDGWEMPSSSSTSKEDMAPVSPPLSSGHWVPPALVQVRTSSSPRDHSGHPGLLLPGWDKERWPGMGSQVEKHPGSHWETFGWSEPGVVRAEKSQSCLWGAGGGCRKKEGCRLAYQRYGGAPVAGPGGIPQLLTSDLCHDPLHKSVKVHFKFH